jgi:hypothetical protein
MIIPAAVAAAAGVAVAYIIFSTVAPMLAKIGFGSPLVPAVAMGLIVFGILFAFLKK